ncbi:unnamed protein product [Rotaria sp. Silwood2]|nr:unnamed protein product [Rotaria sp. Silwood2]CAF4520730.1 unnamed protein product [Rotaria sp. Silwood2]
MGSLWNKIVCLFQEKEEIRILIDGLDSAGKTTVLYVMKFGEDVQTISTPDFNIETIEFRNFNITAWDIVGRERIRPLWKNRFKNISAIVFVIDSTDRERLKQMYDALYKIVNDDELNYQPILILANKQDLSNAMRINELCDKLSMDKIGLNRKWHIQETIATKSQGLHQGFKWLMDQLANKKVNVSNPITETINDSKVIAKRFLSIFNSINVKSIFQSTI